MSQKGSGGTRGGAGVVLSTTCLEDLVGRLQQQFEKASDAKTSRLLSVIDGLEKKVDSLNESLTEARTELDALKRDGIASGGGGGGGGGCKKESNGRIFRNVAFRIDVPFQVGNLMTAISGGGGKLERFLAKRSLHFIDRLDESKEEAHHLLMPLSPLVLEMCVLFFAGQGKIDYNVWQKCAGRHCDDFPTEWFDREISVIMGTESSKHTLLPLLSEKGRQSRKIILDAAAPALLEYLIRSTDFEDNLEQATANDLEALLKQAWAQPKTPSDEQMAAAEEEEAAGQKKKKKEYSDDELFPLGCLALFGTCTTSDGTTYDYPSGEWLQYCETTSKELGLDVENISLVTQAYHIFLYRKLTIKCEREADRSKANMWKVCFDIDDQKKEFVQLVPRILNIMASPTLCPTTDEALLQYQEDNDYTEPVLQETAKGTSKKKPLPKLMELGADPRYKRPGPRQ